MSDLTLNDLRARKASRRSAGGRIASLPDTVKIPDLVRALGFHPDRPGLESDGKVDHEWHAEIGGAPVAVWDYKGSRWSVGGSPAGAALLAAKLGVALER